MHMAPGLFSRSFLHSLSVLALVAFAAGCAQDYDLNKNKGGNAGNEEEEEEGEGTGENTGEGTTETGSVKGRVCDLTGDTWVVGAVAWVAIDSDGDGEQDARIEALTDADGYFLLEGVPLGDQTIHIEKGSFSTTIEVTLTEPGVLELAEEECLSPEDVKIAVITGQYDNIQALLTDMGVEYDTYNGKTGTAYIDFLTDPEKMAEYNIIFFNCGISDGWISSNKSEIGTNIKDYIVGGGSIYASDWAFYFFESAFTDAVDFYGNDSDVNSARKGVAGELSVDVVDETMQAILGGSTAKLNYDLDVWAVPQSVNSDVEILVSGDPSVYADDWGLEIDELNNVPLALRLDKEGSAIYTSFHNEAQSTDDMELMLNEIILSL